MVIWREPVKLLSIFIKKFLVFLWLPISVMSQTEMQSYQVVRSFSEVEIRFYPPVMMAKHTANNEGSGFGKLFNYISGNNSKQTKIAMTTPVHMEKSKEVNSMAFVLPKHFNQDNTPLPNEDSLTVFEDQGGYFAAIRYSGYTSTVKEKEYTSVLKNLLEKEKITPSGLPKILVYDSPYKFINRRNEILIPIEFN